MNRRILVIGASRDRCAEYADADTEVEARNFGEEINDLESIFFEHIGTHNVIQFVVEAEKRGFDAAVIGCFLDPGLEEARELVKMPVIGVGEATLHLAAMLTSGKFSVIIPGRKTYSRLVANAWRYGVESRIASWRMLNLSVAEMMKDREMLRSAVHREAKLAVEQDGAEVICLGCTVMAGMGTQLQVDIGVPVLDPVLVGVKMAEFQATLWQKFRISHSKIGGYEPPPANDLKNAYNASYGVVRKVLYHFRNK